MTDLHLRNLLNRLAESDDKSAFTIFFNEYYSRLIQFAMLFVHSYSLAEDVVSEVLIRLVRRRKELCNIQNFKGYLFQSVKHEALNQLKQYKRQRDVLKPLEDEKDHFLPDLVDPCEQLLEKELRAIVFKIVNELPPKRRMVYKLVKDEGMRYRDVAELLEISERTVEEHLKIAVRSLREGVTAYFAEKRQKADFPFLKLANAILLLLVISL